MNKILFCLLVPYIVVNYWLRYHRFARDKWSWVELAGIKLGYIWDGGAKEFGCVHTVKPTAKLSEAK